MNPRSTRRRLGQGPVAIAGWLMAELSLVLMIVMIGSQAPAPVEFAPEPATTPSRAEPVSQAGLVTEPMWLEASLDGGPGAAAASLAEQVRSSGVRPGLVLVWGIGNERTGTAVSSAVRKELQWRLDGAVDPDPASRAYYKGPSDKFHSDQVYAEIFYFTG